MNQHRHRYPQVLTRFKALPGEYGNLELRAENAHAVRFQLTGEFLDLNRNDAQEVIRVLSGWLAEPANRVVIDNEGGETTVIIDDDGPRSSGSTQVVIGEREGNDRSHVEGGDRHRRPT